MTRKASLVWAACLPIAAFGLVTLIRTLWPGLRTGVPWSIDLFAAGILALLLANALLWNRSERLDARWVVIVVAYDVVLLLATIVLSVVARATAG